MLGLPEWVAMFVERGDSAGSTHITNVNGTVVIWSRACTAGFARARLAAA